MNLKPKVFCSAFLFLFFAWSNTALCNSNNHLPPQLNEKQIMGWVEYVEISGTNMRLKAKLDTGAKTSSIHARNIERYTKNEKQWVRFELQVKGRDAYVDKSGKAHAAISEQTVRVEKPLSRVVKIKRHKQTSIERPVVKMTLVLADHEHEVEFTLTDRSKFIYPVLLGRRFLKDVALVDPGKTFLTSNTNSPRPKKPATIPVTKSSQYKNTFQ